MNACQDFVEVEFIIQILKMRKYLLTFLRQVTKIRY